MRHQFKLEALDEWRRETVDPELALLRRDLEELLKADEIADAVAEKMRHTRTVHLTLVQKTAAFVVGAAAVASAIHGWVH